MLAPAMKVVWISHRGGVAGAELSLVEGVRGLAGRGVEVEVVVPWRGPLEERLAAAGASVTHARHARWVSAGRRPQDVARRLGRNARWLRPLVRALGRSGADVVVTNTITAPLGAFAARLLRLPHVWYVHEYGVEEHGIRFDLGRATSVRLVRRLSDAVIVNSQALRDHFAPLLGVEPTVVYYAVEVPERLSPPPADRGLRLVQVATLDPGKGQADAIRAVGLLTRRGVDVRLRLVGPDTGGHAAALRELARRERVEERVELAGFTDDPAAEVAGADVALTCSRLEAFGRATVEAMKLGRPVVGAASGGTVELVRDGWSGLLYPPGDASALADRLERLDLDRALVRELGDNARTWANATFTTERFADGLLSVLESVRRSPRTPA
jgi:glycosyltransferase involved in cell wall biosynthesis